MYIIIFDAIAPPTPTQWARASSFTMILDHTQRRTIVCKTPLYGGSARHMDLYLKTHNTHYGHTCPPWDSKPQPQ
jgi:hypothetical protein